MKLILSILFTLTSLAVFQPQADIGTCSNLYAFKNDCDKQNSNSCLEITDCNYAKLSSEQTDDFEKPINVDTDIEICTETKSDIEICVETIDDPETTEIDESVSIESDCLLKFESKICAENFVKTNELTQVSCVKSDQKDCELKYEDKICVAPKYKHMENDTVFCRELTGYEKKTRYFSEIDTVKKAEYEARQLVEAGIAFAQKRIDHGKKVVALMVYRNGSKTGLTEAQIEQMVNTYSGIKQLLETGSLNTAKTKISEIVADGVLVTELDKAALVAEIDRFSDL